MALKLAILGLFLIFTATAKADQTRDIARCAAISGSAERLSCYDGLARRLGVSEPQTTTARGSGNWHVRTETSPIDDSKNVTMTLRANDSFRDAFGREQRPNLVVRCRENRTELLITWGEFLGLDSHPVLERIDRNQATTETWSVSTNNMATFRRGNVTRYVSRLLEADQVLFQTTPHGRNPVMMTFDLAGMSEAIRPLRSACGW